MPTDGTVRDHTAQLLAAIGVSRIIIVDDQYAHEDLAIEDLIGIVEVLDLERRQEVPNTSGIDFSSPREIWTAALRDCWNRWDDGMRRTALDRARGLEDEEPERSTTESPGEGTKNQVDHRAAESLEEILGKMADCEYITLSLDEWTRRSGELLEDDNAANTLILFDRNFEREQDGATDHGLRLIQQVQSEKVGYCGLISHTVPTGGEHDVWKALAQQSDLDLERFVVIAKARLTGDPPDYYGFLGMLRLVALSGRYSKVISHAWAVFEQSVSRAKDAVENWPVLDFDQIVFGSSRREGVSELATLFRVFSTLMRREAQASLYGNNTISTALADARRVSAMPDEIAVALREEGVSTGALRMQRFECYEEHAELNLFHTPIDIGDIFERPSSQKRFILLAQPCDLMVRENGKRDYDDDRLARTGTLVELVVDPGRNVKENWEEVPLYHVDTGEPAFAALADVHHVQLAVLDLCALQADGVAAIDVDEGRPELLIEPWKKRYELLRKFFNNALKNYEKVKDKVGEPMKSLAFPMLSATLRLQAAVSGQMISYDLKRVMRLRQPRSGALLTAFAHYQARTAFEHRLDARPRTAQGNS